MKATERITINYLTCTMSELLAAERKQARLESDGYVFAGHHGNTTTYRLGE